MALGLDPLQLSRPILQATLFLVIAYAWQGCSVTNIRGSSHFDAGKAAVRW